MDLLIKKEFIDNNESSIQANVTTKPSLNRQLELLKISKTAYYYTPTMPFSRDKDIKLLNTIDKIHTKYPYYGTRRVEKLLKRLSLHASVSFGSYPIYNRTILINSG